MLQHDIVIALLVFEIAIVSLVSHHNICKYYVGICSNNVDGRNHLHHLTKSANENAESEIMIVFSTFC